MKWFRVGYGGLRYDVPEWGEAIGDPEDLEKVSALGRRVYRDCVRSAGARADKAMDPAFTAFAHILHHMNDRIGDDVKAEVVWMLEEGWKVNERAFWESPQHSLGAYKPFLKADAVGRGPCLERVGHDLLVSVRPNLMRLVWAMLVADGRGVELRGVERADGSGSSLLVPMALLDRLLAEGVPEMLDEEDSAGLLHLARTLSVGSKEGVETDEVLRVVLEREYMIAEKGVWIWPYLRSEEGLFIGDLALKGWAEKAVHSLSAMFAFKAMLVASMFVEHGRIDVGMPSDEKR